MGIAALMYTETEPTVITDLEMYQHRGMVYALENNENKTIIYVEVIFGNCFYGFDYEEYIDNDLLPDNFDATENNVYQEIYVEEMNETQDW